MLWFFLAGVISYAPSVSGYTIPVHEVLTREAIDFAQFFNPYIILSAADREAVLRGSRDEDNSTRPLNHFYNPATDAGVLGAESARAWSQDSSAQAGHDLAYILMGGSITQAPLSAATDFSWSRAVYEVAFGDSERGWEALGHILHLIQDTSVPDHTRGDLHPSYADSVIHQASFFEDWADAHVALGTGLAATLIELRAPVPRYVNLDDAFTELATFSSSNFLSRNTQDRSFQSGDQPLLDPHNPEARDQTLRVYWDQLVPAAVRTSAGVLRLFVRSVGDERETEVLKSTNASLVSRLAGGIAEEIARR